MNAKTQHRFQVVGWALFIACAFMFIVDSLQNGSLLMVIASITFLIACIFFIIPLLMSSDS